MKSCCGSTKTGKPCRAPAGSGGLCYFHANPDNAKKLGQIGGLKNRRFTGVDIPVPEEISATNLCKLELQVVRGVLSGDIPDGTAKALAQMFNLLHEHVETADIEKRIAVLEQVSEDVSGEEPAPPSLEVRQLKPS